MGKKTEDVVIELAEVVPVLEVCRCSEEARERGKVERQAAKVLLELARSGADRS